MIASIGTPLVSAAGSSSASTCSAPSSIAPSTSTATSHTRVPLEEARQPDTGDGRDGQVAPRRMPVVGPRRRAVVLDRLTRPPCAGLPETHARSSSRLRVLRTCPGLDPCPARLRGAPPDVVQLGGLVRVRVDGQQAAGGERPPGPLDRQIEPVRRSVHLEGRAGPGGLREDRVPVEVEIVTGLDHAARWMGDHVDVRVADRVERPPRQLVAWLAAPDVERRDDEVEPREQLVGVVEFAIGSDLQLAAVQQAEAFGRRLRGSRARRVPPARTAR